MKDYLMNKVFIRGNNYVWHNLFLVDVKNAIKNYKEK